MNSVTLSKQAHLTQAVSHYWQAYGEYSDKPTGTFRNWSDYDDSFLRKIGEATHDLFCALAFAEGLSVEERSHAFGSSLELVPPVFASLAPIGICIYPLVKSGPSERTAQRKFYSRFEPRLNLVVLPYRSAREDCESAAKMRAEGTNIVLLSPEDIDALASMQWTLNEMLQYKTFRIFLQGGVDADAVFLDWQVKKFREQTARVRATSRLLPIKKAIKARGENPRLWVKHPKLENLLNAVANNACVFVVGASASGKSTLALDLGLRQETRGVQVFYVNVATLTDQQLFQIGSVLFKRLLKPNADNLLILDDLHCRPEIGKNLLTYLRLFQDTGVSNGIHVLGTCWPNYFDEFRTLRKDARIINIEATDIKDSLIAKFGGTLTKDRQKQVLDVAGDDLLILRLLLEFIRRHELAKDYFDVAEDLWNQRSRDLRGDRFAFKRAMLLASSLGQYECDVPETFLRTQAGITKDQIQELCRAKLLNRRGDRYYPPHRSYARLMASYLGTQDNLWSWFKQRKGIHNAAELVLNYIQILDPSEVWSVLELISKSEGIQVSYQFQRETVFIIESWKRINELLRKVYEQQTSDPKWGRAISSATFACEALGAVGKRKEAQGSIEFIRDVYRVDSNCLVVDVSRLSTVSDFEAIRSRMKSEELTQTFVTTYSLETADDLNVNLMHENWASGLVLCAEESLHDLDQVALTRLAEAVEARVEEGGYFYPSRVPWVTARVLMGLGRCGRSIENSAVVRRAAEWLLRSRKEGGAREGSFWIPGTGTWNTNIETTAMCIIALRTVGIPSHDPILTEAMDWLYQQKRGWTEHGHELDGAVAIEAYLSMNRDWREIIKEITYLSKWAESQAFWMYATESAQKTQEQSCLVGQIAAFLIKAMWSILRSDLPSLLTAFGLDRNRREKASMVSTRQPMFDRQAKEESLGVPQASVRPRDFSYDVALSYASEDREYVGRVATCLKKAGVKVFYDKFEQVDLWGKDLYVHLDEVYRTKARFCVMFLSTHYAQKAWTSHERRSAQARAFQENQEYILPVRFDDTEVPGISQLTAYIDGTKHTPSQLCKMIREKLQLSDATL